MSRSYRISVNGKSYDVVVDELGTTAPAVTSPAPAAVPPVAPVPAAAPPVATGGSKITAPMPGKIWKMHIREGDSVTDGQLILVLEAMKMENEIFAKAGGKIVQINCKEGDSVNTGDVLVVIG